MFKCKTRCRNTKYSLCSPLAKGYVPPKFVSNPGPLAYHKNNLLSEDTNMAYHFLLHKKKTVLTQYCFYLEGILSHL